MVGFQARILATSSPTMFTSCWRWLHLPWSRALIIWVLLPANAFPPLCSRHATSVPTISWPAAFGRIHNSSPSYACRLPTSRVNGTGPSALDGILLAHVVHRRPVSIAKVTERGGTALIMGERGVNNNQFGWPYCGGDPNNTGHWRQPSMSTQFGPLPRNRRRHKHDYHFWSYHPNLAQFICADGSGHVLSYDIPIFPTFQALSTTRPEERTCSCDSEGSNGCHGRISSPKARLTGRKTIFNLATRKCGENIRSIVFLSLNPEVHNIMPRRFHRQAGFTLVELLVVIAIIGTLIAFRCCPLYPERERIWSA